VFDVFWKPVPELMSEIRLEIIQFCGIQFKSCSIDQQNNYTPLHLSLKRQHVGVAALLLRANSDFEAADDHGERAIHYAARFNLLQICQTLCSSGCNVNVPNKSGLYPLHLGIYIYFLSNFSGLKL